MARDRGARPGAAPQRLFVALEVPERVKATVETAIGPLRERYPRARWVPRENWHVTLKFLGATYPRLVDGVRATAATVAAASEPFPSRPTHLGSFPSSHRARVVWAGLEDADGRMGELAAAVDTALADRFGAESRPFTAHLTVARSDPPLSLSREELGPIAGDAFEVRSLTLFRSHLRRPAPRYEALAVFPLGS